ncbi:MAG TPA: galactokinase [Pseudonocardiaceae bacterium]
MNGTAAPSPSRPAQLFARCYGRPPDGVWRAPGRINLIGEHTDYNDGLVLPFALAQGVSVAVARRADVLELRSRQMPGAGVTIRLDDLRPGSVVGWGAYPAGAVWSLRQAGYPVGGASVLFDGDLPLGAGLASSSAAECAIALALRDLYELPIDRAELARLARRSGSEFVGVPCGVLDQSAALMCASDHALLLDCRTGATAQVPLDLTGQLLLVIDTQADQRLVDGEYAVRRTQCRLAACLLGVRSLRSANDRNLAVDDLADPVLRQRVAHVVSENDRVADVVGLLRAGDTAAIGPVLSAAHASLRDRFEVSWPQADVAVDVALRAGALGARMLGCGFGGSVIALVPRHRAQIVRHAVSGAYADRGWRPPTYLRATPSAGARHCPERTTDDRRRTAVAT